MYFNNPKSLLLTFTMLIMNISIDIEKQSNLVINMYSFTILKTILIIISITSIGINTLNINPLRL